MKLVNTRQCPSQSSTNNENCCNYKKAKVKIKIYHTFQNLEGVIMIRRRKKKKDNPTSDDYKFKKVRYICKYPDCSL